MRALLIIVDLTIREAYRRKLMWTALVLGAAFVGLYSVGFYFIHKEVVQSLRGASVALNSGLNFVIVAGFYVVSFLSVMLAVLMSVGTLSGEISSQTIQTLATKPMPRHVIVVGKWLGLAIMLVCYVSLLCGGLVLSTWAISRLVPPNPVSGILLICLQGIVMLSLSLVGGTRLSTVTNGVVAFMLYGLAFIGGWMEQIGSFAHNETVVDIGIISSLLVPSEALWRLAAYIMQPPAIRALGLSPFSIASAPSTMMLFYAGVYILVLVVVACLSFQRRDL